MEVASRSQQKIAGFWSQIRIILWKNTIIYLNNRVGLIFELLLSVLFIVMISLIIDSNEAYLTEPDLHLPTQPVLSNQDSFYESTVYYYPSNKMTDTLIKNAQELLLKNSNYRYKNTQTCQAANSPNPAGLNSTELERMWVFVSFDSNMANATEWPKVVDYTIYKKMYENRLEEETDSKFTFNAENMYSNSPEYFCHHSSSRHLNFKGSLAHIDRSFNAIKHAIDVNLMQLISKKPHLVKKLSSMTEGKYLCPSYTSDTLKTMFSFFMPCLVSLAFLSTFIINTNNMIVEKESKMKEYLKLVGVRPVVTWICLFFRSMIVYFILSLIVTLTFGGEIGNRPFLVTTSSAIVFLVLTAFSIQTTFLSILVGHIFSRSLPAKLFSIFMCCLTIVNPFGGMSYLLYYTVALFPNYALNFCFQVIYQYERSEKDLGFAQLFSNIFYDINDEDHFDARSMTIGGLILSMLLWSSLFALVSWYIEQVHPGEFGVKLPFNFPFTRKYWFNDREGLTCGNVEESELLKEDVESENPEFFEKATTSMKPTVRISNLTKTFTTSFDTKTVVNRMSLNFYEDQITGFLGHNGAGKTTVTFILCGIHAPTSGTALILDRDIRTEMDVIRRSIGFCPQQNILFEELTVEQHLKLVASIKGFVGAELKSEIDRVCSLVDLQPSLKKKSKELSGGMKRRLALAMAFIGDSKVIILDEPTSGLDPFNRRTVWDLLRRYKKGRTIILTTHYMDEADALSDRIALMNHGQIKSCGSPIFLKDKFGSGYRVTLTKSEDFDKEMFENLVRSTIGQAPNVLSNMAQEFCIGIKNNDKSNLPQLLNSIEINKQSIGILNYGISTSTVEEVFLKIGSIDSKEESLEHDLLNVFRENNEQTPFLTLVLQQLKALVIKRFRLFKRRYFIAILTLILPILMEGLFNTSPTASLTGVVNLFNPQTKPMSSYSLDIAQYGQQNLPYKIHVIRNGDNQQASVDQFEQVFKKYFTIEKINLEKVDGNLTVREFVSEKQNKDVMNLVRNYYHGVELYFNSDTKEVSGDIYFNEFALHTSSSILEKLNNFFLAYYSNDTDRQINTINSVISTKNEDKINILDSTEKGNDIDSLQCIEGVPFSNYDFVNGLLIAFLVSFSVMNIIRERKNGSKFLQLLSGTHPIVYWTANYIFDFTMYFINALTIIVVLSLVSVVTSNINSEAYILMRINPENMFYLLGFLMVASMAWCSLAYIWSFLFESDVAGFLVLFGVLSTANFVDMIFGYLNYFYGLGTCHLNWETSSMECKKTDEKIIMEVLRVILLFLFPNVPVKRAFYGLKIETYDCTDRFDAKLNTHDLHKHTYVPFVSPGFSKFLVPLVTFFIVGNIVLCLLENSKRITAKVLDRHKKNKSRLTTDESDVLKENARIKEANLNVLTMEEPFVASGLYKRYRDKKFHKTIAVEDVSFGVKTRECFGLLGLNGAGKTTTLKMLTGELLATDGHAFVNGYDITAGKGGMDIKLGFCPQADYLPDFLTVSEVLYLYANLRGIAPDQQEKVVEEFIMIFKLSEHRNKLTENLSGGNKRKLGSAVAFIGRPKTVILDEPTSGMDPAAKRYLWNVIKKARDIGTTIILTTHSMEEAEALCTKLGIMVNGRFDCFGNPQNLKVKYGKGYTLVIKCKSEANTEAVETFINSNIPGAMLKERQNETMYYQIINKQSTDENQPNTSGLTIGYIFNLFELNKIDLNLETYSLCQTSLEQIFMLFASKQRNQEAENSETLMRAAEEPLEMDLIQ